MKIPKKFKLFGQTINIIYDTNLLDEKNWQGSSSYRRNYIKLVPSSTTHPRNKEQTGATFCHELVHHLFYFAEFKLENGNYAHADEKTVELVAQLLHQALTTMEYK